ncbi:MAG TPA: radical SAM protein [Bacteroidales bacterium]|nr:radical SAM protein [Bacteroidales bacterium]
MYTYEEQILLSNCQLCPRECSVDRFAGGEGYCSSDAGMNIASICIHRGEEPVISGPDGICNIFFEGCNLRCIYCQNHEISRPGRTHIRSSYTLEDTLQRIENILSTGIKAVGFVSPSHVVPQVKAIIRGLHERGLKPIMIYNTNGYEKPEIVDSLDGLVDVYLPDYKYVTPAVAREFSDASDYPDIVLKALRRMYFQKGSKLLADDEGRAESGILIRHLVLPGYSEESIKVLRNIADELSPGVNISLMSQYHPNQSVKDQKELGRSLYRSEYETVTREMEKLGFRNGWLQDMNSNVNYRPDFSRGNPFE